MNDAANWRFLGVCVLAFVGVIVGASLAVPSLAAHRFELGVVFVVLVLLAACLRLD